MSEANKKFHMAIAVAGRNPYLSGFYERLLDQGRRMLHLHFDYLERTHDGILLTEEHAAMLEAIRARSERFGDLFVEHPDSDQGKPLAGLARAFGNALRPALREAGWLSRQDDASRPRLMAWLERIHGRPAYQRALEKGGPYELMR